MYTYKFDLHAPVQVYQIHHLALEQIQLDSVIQKISRLLNFDFDADNI